MKYARFAATAALLVCAAAAQADQVINDDLIVTNNACIGPSCADGEDFSGFTPLLKLKGTLGAIDYTDENTGGGFSTTDWRLQFNESVLDQFMLKDTSAGTTPFTVQGGAPSNSVFIADSGNVGIGTSLPETELHLLVPSSIARFTLEAPLQNGKWQMSVGNTGFFLRDENGSAAPFILENNAPSGTFYAESDGNIGLGTQSPDGKLHTKGDGVQLAYFESGDGGPVQVRFRTDSENRRFLAVNNANEVKSQIIFLDDRINFTGQTDSGANLWLSIGPNGIVSQGPTCGSPCDLTFDPEVFTVPDIEDRAAYMWDNMHLPAIGPTSPDVPINLTEKMGGVIHELEVAHIYIEELHKALVEEQAKNAEQAALLAASKTEDAQQSALIAELSQRLSMLEAQALQ